MSGRFLLDTNIVIALFANDAQVVVRLQDAGEVFVPSIVVGELYYGAQKSGRTEQNLAQVDDFAASSSVLDCNLETAQWYGQVKSRLRRKGLPIPDNDIWVAATALQHSLILATRDLHFAGVDRLGVEMW